MSEKRMIRGTDIGPGQWWEPERIGESVSGIVVSVRERRIDIWNVLIVELMDASGERVKFFSEAGLPLARELRRREVKPGRFLRLTYTDERMSDLDIRFRAYTVKTGKVKNEVYI